jgi:hypothetical protein
MVEASKGRVSIDDIPSQALKELLSFIYTGRRGDTAESVKSDSVVLELLAAAEKYHIDDLKVL